MRNTLIVVAAAALVAVVAWAGPPPSKEDAPTGTPAQIADARGKVEAAKAAVQRAEAEVLAAKVKLSAAQTALFLLEETPAQRKAREDRQRWEQEHNPKPSSGKPG